jgi:hypothetical protein
MRYLAYMAILCSVSVSLSAQSPSMAVSAQSSPAAPAWSPSKDIGVFVFGRNSQTADQQLKDESDCYGAAKQQSGIDPKAPAPTGKTAEQKQAEQKAAADNADTPKGGRVKGAARGAAGGAVAGTMRGGTTQRQASAESKKDAASKVAVEQKAEEERTKLAHAEGLDTFQRAFAACMEARNYSVK